MCFVTKAQSINEVKGVNTIQNSFDRLTIQSYSAQANTKVKDLFEYLKLLQENKGEEELAQQLTDNIRQLFINDNLELASLSSKRTFTNLLSWLSEFEKSKITIDDIEFISSKLQSNFWLNQYRLSYTLEGKRKKLNLSIQIYFQIQSKSFGNTTRNVWNWNIGNIELL